LLLLPPEAESNERNPQVTGIRRRGRRSSGPTRGSPAIPARAVRRSGARRHRHARDRLRDGTDRPVRRSVFVEQHGGFVVRLQHRLFQLQRGIVEFVGGLELVFERVVQLFVVGRWRWRIVVELQLGRRRGWRR
jgi:hypothetical protein